MHPAGRPEFTHAGIYKRVTRASTLPRPQPVRILPPPEPLEVRAERLGIGVREMVEQMMGKLTPTDFGEELMIDDRRLIATRGLAHDRMPDLARGDFAKVQMR